jgi:hypothetical protein
MEKVAYRRPDGTFVRYEVSGGVGLAFSIELEGTEDKAEVGLRNLRLRNLTAASVCAVTRTDFRAVGVLIRRRRALATSRIG